ncbi:MAG: hypothetical protein KJZ72_21875, partial [Anaerolineales bacterium]|nr:hypothetical protein [Anaerolineales bacterium]
SKMNDILGFIQSRAEGGKDERDEDQDRKPEYGCDAFSGRCLVEPKKVMDTADNDPIIDRLVHSGKKIQ